MRKGLNAFKFTAQLWKMKEDGVHLKTRKETMHDDGAPLSGARDGNSHEIAPRTFEELRCCDGCCSCLPHCVNFQGASQQKSESAGLKRSRLLELRAEERGTQKMKTQSPKAAAVDADLASIAGGSRIDGHLPP